MILDTTYDGHASDPTPGGPYCAEKDPLSLKQLSSYFKLPMEEACARFNESEHLIQICAILIKVGKRFATVRLRDIKLELSHCRLRVENPSNDKMPFADSIGFFQNFHTDNND